jgi:excisionase family DNA binding protein
MSTTVGSGALTSREEVPAPPSTSTSGVNDTILSGLPDVLTPEQAANVLQISITGARQLCREKTLPSFKVGAQWRIPTSRLCEFMLSGGSNEQRS